MSAQPSHDKDGLKSATGLILTALFALVWLGMLLRACCSQAQIFSNGTPPTGQDEARAWWSAATSSASMALSRSGRFSRRTTIPGPGRWCSMVLLMT